MAAFGWGHACPHFHGNKLADCQENPLDVTVLWLTERILPLMHRTGHTPNAITTYSVAFKGLCVYSLWSGRPGWMVTMACCAYFFDCMDGQMARAYGMTSPLGDLYDHATDGATLVALGCVIWLRYRANVDRSGHCVLL